MPVERKHEGTNPTTLQNHVANMLPDAKFQFDVRNGSMTAVLHEGQRGNAVTLSVPPYNDRTVMVSLVVMARVKPDRVAEVAEYLNRMMKTVEVDFEIMGGNDL